MAIYRLKHLCVYILVILFTASVVTIPYILLFNYRTLETIAKYDNPSVTLGVSLITVATSIFAILEVMVSWLKSYRENSINRELIQVIQAQSKSPGGMDLYALERESHLPQTILQDRLYELILRGRIGVKLTQSHNQEYFFIMPEK